MRKERMASTLEVGEGEGRGNTANSESGCLGLERSRARMRLMEMIVFSTFPNFNISSMASIKFYAEVIFAFYWIHGSLHFLSIIS